VNDAEREQLRHTVILSEVRRNSLRDPGWDGSESETDTADLKLVKPS
jgi:hypothetical protein